VSCEINDIRLTFRHICGEHQQAISLHHLAQHASAKRIPYSVAVLQAVVSKYYLICEIILIITGVEALQDVSGGQTLLHREQMEWKREGDDNNGGGGGGGEITELLTAPPTRYHLISDGVKPHSP
jgi:hypothetical protein